jgi:hypothetical protein
MHGDSEQYTTQLFVEMPWRAALHNRLVSAWMIYSYLSGRVFGKSESGADLIKPLKPSAMTDIDSYLINKAATWVCASGD